MTDNSMRNLIAATGTLVALLAYLSGYFSALHGWWWTVVGLIAIFVTIRKLVDV